MIIIILTIVITLVVAIELWRSRTSTVSVGGSRGGGGSPTAAKT